MRHVVTKARVDKKKKYQVEGPPGINARARAFPGIISARKVF